MRQIHCKVCDEVFPNDMEALIAHSMKHEKWKCPHCDKEYDPDDPNTVSRDVFGFYICDGCNQYTGL